MDIIIHGLNFEYVHWQFGEMVVFCVHGGQVKKMTNLIITSK
jgi:hypothetical protein